MTKPFFHPISKCRLCDGAQLTEIIDIGKQALSGCFPAANEPDPPSAPLVLVMCESCGLVQLRDTVVASEMFTYDYGYRSGINATMRQHLVGIVEWMGRRCELKADDLVVDIGCNDGTLLKSYRTPGLERVGVDAIIGKFRGDYPSEIRTIEGFFTAKLVAEHFVGRRAKTISSIAMFYDIEEPHDFVSAIAALLADDGIWVMEQSYLVTMLETNAFDTICHEHLEYYALEQIQVLIGSHGLRVFDVEKNTINGGSFRIAICQANSCIVERETVKEFKAAEQKFGLRTRKPFDAFAARVTRIRDELNAFINRESAAGKKIYVYGASTKGNTLLQYCGLDHGSIVAAADRNPEKWNHQTPLTRIPIVSEEVARKDKPDYFLVLPWHFREEFLAREQTFRDGGGRFIFPMPEFEIV